MPRPEVETMGSTLFLRFSHRTTCPDSQPPTLEKPSWRVPTESVWYELLTPDRKAAESFYHGVVGWRLQDAGMSDPYTLLCVGETPIGGLMELSRQAREAGVRAGWRGHIAVDDVDSLGARVIQAGGALHHPPEDIPGVGRFATVSDPHGTMFVIFKGASDAQSREIAPNTPGRIGWHELHAGDGARAFAFYAALFGWTKGEAMDMGAMGIYQLFATGKDPVGGIMTKTEAMPVPAWLYYFEVDEIQAGCGAREGQGRPDSEWSAPGARRKLDRPRPRSAGADVRASRTAPLISKPGPRKRRAPR
jgi:predicted enzyme related to lactoylglutathione lyase